MGNRKQPFGYKMEFGEIVPQPQEAETVRSIYLQYLAGASFKQLAERLQTEDVPYDGDKPWNKNMVHGKDHGKSQLDDGGYLRG